MEDFTLSELGVFLGVIGGILTSILLTIQKSRCKKIHCCGLKCERDPKNPQHLQALANPRTDGVPPPLGKSESVPNVPDIAP